MNKTLTLFLICKLFSGKFFIKTQRVKKSEKNAKNLKIRLFFFINFSFWNFQNCVITFSILKKWKIFYQIFQNSKKKKWKKILFFDFLSFYIFTNFFIMSIISLKIKTKKTKKNQKSKNVIQKQKSQKKFKNEKFDQKMKKR